MILEEETFETFGYYPNKLKPKSCKLIIVTCERCGEFRILRREDYRTFCHSCSMILGGKVKGKNCYMFGKTGEKNPAWKPKVKCTCL